MFARGRYHRKKNALSLLLHSVRFYPERVFRNAIWQSTTYVVRPLIMFTCCLIMSHVCEAGGGPENVFLVVNSRSWASRSIANHYIDLRYIPRTNVFYVNWSRSIEQTDIVTFRQRILNLIITAIDKRGLSEQIDYIVYSSDFPYEVDFSAEREGRFMSGSLTGLTFLYESVLTGDTSSLGVPNNFYANLQSVGNTTSGFSNLHSWLGPNQKAPTLEEGRRYMLSAMLGYSSGVGNGYEEIVHYLRRSAMADATHPEGTIYLCGKADEVRSKTRSIYFDAVVGALRKAGARAEIVDGHLPTNRNDVMGVMLGKAKFQWATARSEILPGAICDNLTSFGGILARRTKQTTLAEFMRNGAAGSSGTVVEPYALAPKFPHPIIHLHYFRGCSLGEAFYQSLRMPYQLLVVGDPLCKPYATEPQVRVNGIRAGEEVTGIVRVEPSIASPEDLAVRQFQCFIDGVRRDSCVPGQSFEFDTSTLPQGFHELRIVAVLDDRIENQGRYIVPFMVRNLPERQIKVQLLNEKRITWDERVEIQVDSPGSRQLVVFHNGNLVASQAGESAKLTFTPKRLGLGPVHLMVGALGNSKTENIFSKPIRLEIDPGPLLPSRPQSVGMKLEPGVQVIVNGKRTSAASTEDPKWLAKSGVKGGSPFEVGGTFTVPRDSVYQFQVELKGGIQLVVDGNTLLRVNRRPEENTLRSPHLPSGRDTSPAIECRCGDPPQNATAVRGPGHPATRRTSLPPYPIANPASNFRIDTVAFLFVRWFDNLAPGE